MQGNALSTVGTRSVVIAGLALVARPEVLAQLLIALKQAGWRAVTAVDRWSSCMALALRLFAGRDESHRPRAWAFSAPSGARHATSGRPPWPKEESPVTWPPSGTLDGSFSRQQQPHHRYSIAIRNAWTSSLHGTQSLSQSHHPSRTPALPRPGRRGQVETAQCTVGTADDLDVPGPWHTVPNRAPVGTSATTL